MDDYVRTFEDNGGVHINFRFKTEGGVDYFPSLSEPATSDSDELPEEEAVELKQRVELAKHSQRTIERIESLRPLLRFRRL
jgi:hypothetical protein